MYTIKLCIGLPLESGQQKEVTKWQMLDIGKRFDDYVTARNYVRRLECINGTETTAMAFWIAEEGSENVQN